MILRTMMAMGVEAIVPLFFIAIGSGFLIWTAWNVVSGFLCRDWPWTEGVIIASRLREKADAEDTMYRAEVTYRYSVDRHEYEATRTRYGDGLSLSWSGPAMRIVSRYRAGRVVAVRYNPADPSEAVLEPGTNVMSLVSAAFGVLFVAVGIYVLRDTL